MPEAEFTKVSSKGQVVIPQDVRESLGLREGTPMTVVVQRNTVLLKKIELPMVKSWKEVTKPFRGAATKTGFTEHDLDKLIAEVRAVKR